MFKKIIRLKKNTKFIIIFLILISLVIPTYATDATDDELAKISNARNSIERIQTQKKKVKDTLKNLNNIKDDTQKYIEELDKSLEALTIELNNILDAIDIVQLQIDDTSNNLDLAKKNEEKQYADMKERIKFFYEKGDITSIESILNGNNLSDILTKAEYIKSITEYDRKKLDELIDTKEKIAELEQQLKNQKDALVLLKEEETAQKENIEQLIFAKQKELEEMLTKISLSQKELKKLEADEKAQEANIRAIEEAIEARERAKGNAQRVLRGGLIWPLPSSTTITSRFGSRKSPTKGASTFHQGIDISGKTGEKIVSAAAGEVVIAKYSYSAGNYVMISHGSSIYTVYMHMSVISVKEGQEVVQGQKIGEVGQTGYSTGPHLHFGIRKDGKYVNPLTYVG